MMVFERPSHLDQTVLNIAGLSGWKGHTYSAALEFCQSRASDARDLCSFASLCPNGTGEVSSIQFEHGPVYVPIEGVISVWVEIGDRGQCKVQSELPKSVDVTRYVLCCKTEHKVLDSDYNGSDPSRWRLYSKLYSDGLFIFSRRSSVSSLAI